MPTLSELADAWLRAQREAAQLGTDAAADRAEEARQALADHPAAQHARRTHGANVLGAIEGVDPS